MKQTDFIYITTCEIIECSETGKESSQKFIDFTLVNGAGPQRTLDALRNSLKRSVTTRDKKLSELGYERTLFEIGLRNGEDPDKAINEKIILNSQMEFKKGDEEIKIIFETKKVWIRI